ncbi:MAG: hypothetical protein N4A44_02405 [Alphaproteobacteria bacterium]|jgi:hypothetical protein|nr:hypothetical protein [Alphaproteobacteria bacterium]
MKKLNKLMVMFGLTSLVLNLTTTGAFAASDLLTGELAPFWAKVIQIFGYLKTLFYIGFAFKFIEEMYDKAKSGDALGKGDFTKWGWWIFLLFVLQMIGVLLNFLAGGDTGVNFNAFGGS